MFAEQMASAINDARTLTRLDDLSKAIWQGWGTNAVTDDQAQELASLIHARRLVVRGEVKPVGILPGRPSIFPPRRLQRAPVRSVAIARRRHLAASGPMSPSLMVTLAERPSQMLGRAARTPGTAQPQSVS
jgi:hypothetical protein